MYVYNTQYYYDTSCAKRVRSKCFQYILQLLKALMHKSEAKKNYEKKSTINYAMMGILE
jgi:hypothetical protein